MFEYICVENSGESVENHRILWKTTEMCGVLLNPLNPYEMCGVLVSKASIA